MQTQIVSPAADPSHPSHWQLVLAAIVAAWQAAEPAVITLLPSGAQPGVAVGTALAPVVVQTIQAVSAAQPAA